MCSRLFFSALHVGAQEVAIQQSIGTIYNAIKENGATSPLYNSMALFATLTYGAHLLALSEGSSLQVQAYAIYRGKRTQIVVLNFSSGEARLHFSLSHPYKSASLSTVSAPSLRETSKIRESAPQQVRVEDIMTLQGYSVGIIILQE
ncbi:hypothetical protein [Ktedonobacter robiniae]|uniref:Maltogenic Amylase C-terminal domain-containing protein n=1 Tax=Ktedonobacter robiniae TaxID=2778365 RepID=A0ABQ3V1F6_9CHLR|nr:hypothetical protein [Ktedonobacter robiniae]GHO58475.1 hypothetical protein KSB_69500 [Ktedonobacter robiniae]